MSFYPVTFVHLPPECAGGILRMAKVEYKTGDGGKALFTLCFKDGGKIDGGLHILRELCRQESLTLCQRYRRMLFLAETTEPYRPVTCRTEVWDGGNDWFKGYDSCKALRSFNQPYRYVGD